MLNIYVEVTYVNTANIDVLSAEYLDGVRVCSFHILIEIICSYRFNSIEDYSDCSSCNILYAAVTFFIPEAQQEHSLHSITIRHTPLRFSKL